MFWKNCFCVKVDNSICYDTCEFEPYYGEKQHTRMILKKFRKKIKIVQAICKKDQGELAEDVKPFGNYSLTIEARLIENGFIVRKYPVGICDGGPQLHADTVFLWIDNNLIVRYWRYLCVSSDDMSCT
jgi:hypothetical protein